MARGHRMLTVLLAVAVALMPIGAASAGMPAPETKTPTEQSHALHHDHGAMQMATSADQHGAGHCDRKAAYPKCCDDEGTCAQTCLQKCFGQTAVMPPERTARLALTFRVAPRPAEQPPGWSLTPQPPPPRA